MPFAKGELVRYIFKDNPCRIIATRNDSHRYQFGNEEVDQLNLERPVPHGFEYTIVETGIEWSSYIDAIESELRRLT